LYSHCKITSAPTASPTPMQIHVIDLKGDKYTYVVTPDTTIEDIKNLAKADTGMLFDDINLKDKNDKVLDKHASDLDYNKIVHDDTLTMFFYVHVQTEDGTKYTYEVSPDDSVDDLEDRIKADIKKDTGKEPGDLDLADSFGDAVKSGELGKDNNVKHDDTLFLRPSCPSNEALQTCSNYGYSYCIGRGKSLCTWCNGRSGKVKECIAGKNANLCNVGNAAFSHCKVTEAPTVPKNRCPAGEVYTGSAWACDDKSLENEGFGPATWTKTSRCRGFDDKNMNYKNKKGQHICVESDAGALGYKYGDKCSQKVTFEEAKAHCASMNARLCTNDELQHSCAERTGCDYDYVHVWSGSPCKPSGKFKGGSKGHFVMPGDMRKWNNRNIEDGTVAQGFVFNGAFLPNLKDYIIWPETGFESEGWILPLGQRYRYMDVINDLFGLKEDRICDPEDDEFGRCCIPDSYDERKFFTRCCADYGETPKCEKCPEGKTSLPGDGKDLDDCFCIEGSLDEFGGCSGPDKEKPTGIVTARPTMTSAPTPEPKSLTCPLRSDYYACPKLSRAACIAASNEMSKQRFLPLDQRTGGCYRCTGATNKNKCIGIPGEHVGHAFICEMNDYSHCPAEYDADDVSGAGV